MHITCLFLIASLALTASAAQSTDSSGTESATTTAADYATTGTSYADDSSTITLPTTIDYATMTDVSSAMATGNNTAAESASTSTSDNSTSSSSPTQTLLVGTAKTTTALNGTSTTNATTSSTTTSARPTNTVPCNGYPEFCQRKFSNITYVAAHNSPFIRGGNLAANQMLDVETQLNDGIRMLQFQAHLVNGTMYLCHTSCDLLNAGTLESYLTTVTKWLRAHPHDVITILMGNYDVVDPFNFTSPVTQSGLIDFVYTPPTVPMSLDSWPTLAEMILTNKRAVVMLDYNANQTAIPWLLDEFSNMWETPFSPTDRDFPCTAQRPPDRSRDQRLDRMYMANHNLNLQVSLAGISLLVPFSTLLNETNAVTGYGSAGRAVTNCTEMWDRPPNYLLVDYYNIGNFNGSVFQVAADANNVTYNKDSCCGTAGTSGGVPARAVDLRNLGVALVVGAVACWLM
ncbi:putative secreted protein [Exophiala dermatitidis]